MADDVDIAYEEEARRIIHLLANRTRVTLPFTGMCHNCLEPLSEAQFCDADCRDDYEKRMWFHR